MSWYATPGDSNYNQFNQDVNPKSVYRFTVKKGERKKVLFLDDANFTVQEATLRIGPNRFETFTSSMSADCPLFRASAMKKIRLQRAIYFTVLDLTPFKDRTGKDRKYSKKAFVAKGTAYDTLMRRREEAGGKLAGRVIECFRDGEKSPACGNDFKLVQTVDLTKLPPEDVKPIDFMSVLKPPSAAMLEAILRDISQHEEQPDILSQATLLDDAAIAFGADPATNNAVGSAQAAATFNSDDIPF